MWQLTYKNVHKAIMCFVYSLTRLANFSESDELHIFTRFYLKLNTLSYLFKLRPPGAILHMKGTSLYKGSEKKENIGA